MPSATLIGFLGNSTAPQTKAQVKEAQDAARILSVRLAILNASNPSEIEGAFATFADQHIGALMTGADALIFAQRRQLATLAARHAVPTVFAYREAVEAGGLMSYGPSIPDAFRIVGTYAGRIPNGEKPADLPVQQSTRIEMVLNLKTAKALGLAIPESLLATADEVIQ